MVFFNFVYATNFHLTNKNIVFVISSSKMNINFVSLKWIAKMYAHATDRKIKNTNIQSFHSSIRTYTFAIAGSSSINFRSRLTNSYIM